MKPIKIFLFSVVTLFVLPIIIIPFVCYQEHTHASEVIIYPDSLFLYKLQFKKHIEGRGNIHNMNFEKYEYENSDWIYLRKRLGVLDTSEFVFTHYYAETEYPWRHTLLRGSVELTQDSVKVNLEFPYYKDGVNISAWISSEWNGAYKLRFASEVPPSDAKKGI